MTTLADELAAIARHTDALLTTAGGFADADLPVPSLCEGWSRGHVLAHLARNAEAIERLVGWATSGEPAEMYPGGAARRDADIDEGAGRPAAVQLRDVRETAARLADRLPALAQPAVDEVEMRGGVRVHPSVLPFLRLREVVFHHADLRAGFSFDDVEPDLLVAFIDHAVGQLRRSGRAPSLKVRTDEGDVHVIGDGTAYVTGSRAGVLLWLARRDASGVQGDPPPLPRGA